MGHTYQSRLMSRGSLLLDLHVCAGRWEREPRSHAISSGRRSAQLRLWRRCRVVCRWLSLLSLLCRRAACGVRRAGPDMGGVVAEARQAGRQARHGAEAEREVEAAVGRWQVTVQA
jgi:hypothetical protein